MSDIEVPDGAISGHRWSSTFHTDGDCPWYPENPRPVEAADIRRGVTQCTNCKTNEMISEYECQECGHQWSQEGSPAIVVRQRRCPDCDGSEKRLIGTV